MKGCLRQGLDELVIAIIMKEVAKALEYVHRSGGIHRDVKVQHTVHAMSKSGLTGWQYLDKYRWLCVSGGLWGGSYD